MPASAAAPGRAPSHWLVRLAGWVLALGGLIGASVVLIDRGSYGATEHTISSSPPAELSGDPAATLTIESTHDSHSYLAGPAIARVDEHGVVVSERTGTQELWRYQRTDATVCAHHVSAERIMLVYATADRCNEIIALEPTSGVRQWQRTLEAAHPNDVILADDMFLSVDPTKVIVFQTAQGYERFTLEATRTDHLADGHTVCENVQAAGSPTVAAIQRCRANEGDPRLVQLVLNAASDGKPRETGRSYLSGLVEPQIIGVAEDGATYLRGSDGAVHVLLPGDGELTAVTGLPQLTVTEPLQLVALRGITLLVTGSTAFYLDDARTAVVSSSALVAAPYVDGPVLYLPTPAGIEVWDGPTGALQRTISWPTAPVWPASIVVHGPLVGLRDATGLRVLS